MRETEGVFGKKESVNVSARYRLASKAGVGYDRFNTQTSSKDYLVFCSKFCSEFQQKQIAQGGSKSSKMSIYRFKFKLNPIYENLLDKFYKAPFFKSIEVYLTLKESFNLSWGV